METYTKKSFLNGEIGSGHASLTQRALFSQHMAVMLKSGMTISESLEIATDSAQGGLRKALAVVSRAVATGRTFSSAMADHPKIFSGLMVEAVYAGETSGTLVENFENIALQLEKEKELVSKVKGAMIYPIVVLAATFVLGLAVSFLVLPKIVPLFEGLKVDLPATTRALIWFSHTIEAYGGRLFFGIIFAIFFLTWLVRAPFSKPVTHWLLLHAPIVKNISRAANLARFSRTLGMLLKSGVNIDEALGITKNAIGNYYYARSLGVVSARISKGAKLSESLGEFRELYPIIVVKMLTVGEESGKFEETLFYLAGFYEAEVDTATKSLATAIEPILLIFIGLVVGGLALSIITPIYEITGKVGR